MEHSNNSKFLIDQIKNIVNSKAVLTPPDDLEENLALVNEAICYLSKCISESNDFLYEISRGNLNGKMPSKDNFLVGNLKEIHSGLKHLTWQANQVAGGDYSQSVSYLGEFSDSFNLMIKQLSDREEKLKSQSKALSDNYNLVQSIMNFIDNWIIVVSKETHEILYVNNSAKKVFIDKTEGFCSCHDQCSVISACFTSQSDSPSSGGTSECFCPNSNNYFSIQTFDLMWGDIDAFVNIIVDTTAQRAVEKLAYKDDLTKLYNRRYCMDKMQNLLNDKTPFTLCLVDVDKLKYANDTFGHFAGDTYLKTVAEAIISTIRISDIACRIGGDEFAIIFHNCPVYKAEARLLEVNRILEEKSFDFPMSISYGIHQHDIYSNTESNLDRILELADKAMYINKNQKTSLLTTV